MPTYEYEPTTARSCKHCKSGFEAHQHMKDPPLEKCPECGAPVARVVTGFCVGKGNILSPSTLKAHGFTSLKRVDKDVYEKQ